MYTVLLDGPDPRFLGGSARERNARIVRRAGAALCPSGELSAYQSHAAMLVPADVALMASLFDDPVFNDAVRRSTPTRLDAVSGGSVVVGAAHALASLTNPSSATTLPCERLGPDTLLHVGTPDGRRHATSVALVSSPRQTDGWVSPYVTRPLSRLGTRAALMLGMGANGASLAALIVGLACAAVAARPGYGPFVSAGVLFLVASIFADASREIARVTLTESQALTRTAALVSYVTYVACFVGSTIGWMRDGSGILALTSMVIVAIAVAASLVLRARFVERFGSRATLEIIEQSLRRAAQDTGRWPLWISAGAFALLRRDVLAMLVLFVSLNGVRAAVPAMILLGTLITHFTFVAYAQEMVDAARAERRRRNAAPAA